jgi:hypothetical protein
MAAQRTARQDQINIWLSQSIWMSFFLDVESWMMETPHIWTVKVLTSDTYRDPVKVLDAADRTIALAGLTA